MPAKKSATAKAAKPSTATPAPAPVATQPTAPATVAETAAAMPLASVPAPAPSPAPAAQDPAPAAPAAPAATPAAPKKPSKCAAITGMLDAAVTPGALTIKEIQKALAALGFADAHTPQTISSINAIAVPSWGRKLGRLFRYAITTQQGAEICNTAGVEIQGIAPGARITNTTLAHTFGVSATAPAKMEPAQWNALPATERPDQPKVILTALLAEQAKAAKAAQAATPATATAAPSPAPAPATPPPAAAPAVAPTATTPPAAAPAPKAPTTPKAAKAPGKK